LPPGAFEIADEIGGDIVGDEPIGAAKRRPPGPFME
jgi:hypothetical protein